jgi:Xaa-Pro aminopeptidase
MTLRLKKARQGLRKLDLDAYLVTHLPHIRYLCGFSGSNGLLLISQRGVEFYTDGRYAQQVRSEVKGAKTIVPDDGNLFARASKSPLLGKGHPRVGFQARHLSVAAHGALGKQLNGALLVPQDDLVEPLTAIKDTGEIAYIERATGIVDRAFEHIMEFIQPGVRESEVAAELEYIMLGLGSEGTAFETICASGYRSALPHGRASHKKIAAGDFVTLDYGATVEGYCSDITRTVVVGKASKRHREIYDIVHRAQNAAIGKVRPRASTKAVDEAARSIIKGEGYGKMFGHGTGHGIGLEVHQTPSLSWRTDGTLLPGMIVTIEPGIYVPKFGGVRIEDDVLVTRTGRRVLTLAPKTLMEL